MELTDIQNKNRVVFLKGVRDQIKTPERWTRGVFARDEKNQPVAPNSSFAKCWCLRGAARHLMLGMFEHGSEYLGVCGMADTWLEESLGLGDIGTLTQWNDQPGRTHAEVIAHLDMRIAALEQEAQNGETVTQ